ncbi:ferredoxin [Pseudonocardia alni]|uniref:ferredoxin n=1 Tax=Pseudonocardia alni TaxID=33907 RepID=UPI003330982B
MRYTVDVALCAGHGQCAATAPDVHAVDDEGFHVGAGRTVDVAPGRERAAWSGARACPESAITTFD